MSDPIQQSFLNKSRKDKFLLVMDLPKVLKQWNSTVRNSRFVNLERMQISIYGTLVPRVEVPSEAVRIYGQDYNVTSMNRPNYAPITVGFNVDSNFDNYWMIWKWLNLYNDRRQGGMDPHFAEFKEEVANSSDNARVAANNTASNMQKSINDSRPDPLKYKHIQMVNDYTDYQTTITVYGLREYNEKIVKFDYYNAFVTSLGELKYDYKDPSEMDCSFTFAFNQLDVTLLEPNSDSPV